MNRPPVEVADVIRAAGPAFVDGARTRFDRQRWKVLNAILRCRTAALGGHIDECSRCGHRAISYNSCRNRHCPKCQANARHRWLEARRAELLPTRYVHVVFTIPHELAPLALVNQKLVYGLLFRLVAETLMEFARDPRLLGAEIGFFAVLHTWNQKLEHHPHVHCVVPQGGIALDGFRWVRPRYDWFLPVKAMAKRFRGKFLDALKQAFAAGRLRFPGQMKNLATPRAFALLRQSCRHPWVCYAKRPFGGPEHVLQYLGNYTHRVAISNHRLLALESDQVSFRWRDSAHHNKKRVMTLKAQEFLRRFFLHVLPHGFVRIRHFGFLTNRNRKQRLQLCRDLLQAAGAALPSSDSPVDTPPASFWCCPLCGGQMVIVERLARGASFERPPPRTEVAA
jgi:hypothetical protein